jgi:hypothetical protein
MIVIVVDPYDRTVERHVVHPPTFGDFARERIQNADLRSGIVLPPFEIGGKEFDGLVCVGDANGVLVEGQRFFRFPRHKITFAGRIVFFGKTRAGEAADVPRWFEECVDRIIYCPPETKLLRIEQDVEEAVTPDGTKINVVRMTNVYHENKMGIN